MSRRFAMAYVSAASAGFSAARGFVPDAVTRLISKAPGARLAWVKSSYSGAQGNCVEVAVLPGGGYALRDSKAPQGPALAFGPETFAAFLSGGMVQAVVVRPAR